MFCYKLTLEVNVLLLSVFFGVGDWCQGLRRRPIYRRKVHHIQGENQLVCEVSRCQLSFTPELALALSVKKCAFPNAYTRSMKVNTAVELLVQETYQLCSAILARPKSYVIPATHGLPRRIPGWVWACTARCSP